MPGGAAGAHRRPWELIAVTRGGKAPAVYLAGVQDSARVRVEVVDEPELRGNRAAWHRGLRTVRGEYVALVEGGAIVTDAWLDQLIALADSDPAIGMVAPMSNAAPPPQRAEGTSELLDPGAVDAFAAHWRSERRGQWFKVDVLAGPCLLLKRGVLAATGAGRKLRRRAKAGPALRADPAGRVSPGCGPRPVRPPRTGRPRGATLVEARGHSRAAPAR